MGLSEILLLVLLALVVVLVSVVIKLSRSLRVLHDQRGEDPTKQISAGVDGLSAEQKRLADALEKASTTLATMHGAQQSAESSRRQLVDQVTRMAGNVSTIQSLQRSMGDGQTSLVQTLAQAQTSITTLHTIQRELESSVKNIEGEARVRAEADAQSRELLRRLELVIAGSFQRGAAGENLLAEVLGALPPGMLERNLRVGGGVVEFAVRLPGGRYVPIDSKWTAADRLLELSATTDPTKRTAVAQEIDQQVRGKVEEVRKYLDPEKTLGFGVAAMPDAVYKLCRTAHSHAYRCGVILVPYSLAMPYVLSMFVLISRFGGSLDTSRLRGTLATLEKQLREMDEAIETHMSRGLTMLSNAVSNHRTAVAACRSAVVNLQAHDEEAALLAMPAVQQPVEG